jgi:hypothetical protein
VKTKTGSISIVLDEHTVLFMRTKNREVPELVSIQELRPPGSAEQIMPVLIFRWSVGAGATFSLN